MEDMADTPRAARRRPPSTRSRTRGTAGSARGPEGTRTSSPRISFGGVELSVRVLAVVILIALVLVMVVPSLYQWWQQDRQYREISAEVAQAQQENAAMREELDLWNDPTYIASQARERLGYAKPGETQYAVVVPDGDQQSGGTSSTTAAAGPALPWVEVLTASLADADDPEE